MISFSLCKSCGKPFDSNEIENGFCLACQPEGDPDIQRLIDDIKKDAEE